MIRNACLIAAVLSAAPAHAELTLCNRTSYVMDAAVGLEKNANIVTRGWFHLVPGQCQLVLQGAYDADMSYVYARTPPVYGSAPLPQYGHADLCIRDQNFEFSNARGCAASQQVRFTAARPVDSPKGPEINLAEDADYDDEQARLAGIQRLLVISGYDANPIDGVQGSKTTAALNRFIADRKLPPGAAGEPAFFNTLLFAATNPEGNGFSWCNDTSYAVMASIGTVEMGSIVTRGWYRVPAGKCLRPDLRGDARRLYSYAEAIDANDTVVKRDGKALAWGGDVELCTRDGRFELSDQKECAARGLNSARFGVIDLTSQPVATVRFKE